MREIEIKAKVHDKQKILVALNKASVQLGEPIMQHDRIFGQHGVDGADAKNNAPWLRVRTETKNGVTRHLFTLKKSVTNLLDSMEYETEVANADELLQIIKHIDFEPYSEVKKIRQKGVIGDIEICLDSVEGLGDFIELEKLTTDDADYKAVVAELWEIFKQLGITKKDQITQGYDILTKQAQA